MTTTNFLPQTSLDVPSLKASLQTFLKSQDKFQDYDFDGSNISAVLDLLAAVAFQQTFYLNMVGNEMFLDTALLRDSIISHAKDLNYTPRSRVAATATARVTINAPDNPDSVVIPKFWPITTSVNGQSFTFTTNDAITVRNNGSTQGLVSDPIVFYEGNIVEEWFDPSDPQDLSTISNCITLKSDAIDTQSIIVEIAQSADDRDSLTTWTRAFDLFGIDSESTVYFVQAGQNNQYQIAFGNDSFGAKPKSPSLIKVTYRETSANQSKGARSFSPGRAIEQYSNISIQTLISASGGAERETDLEIKTNAPRSFAVQNRAINDSDYIQLLKTQFPMLEAISVYGGEDATPRKMYSKVIVVTKPYDGEITSQTIKSAIISYLVDIMGLTATPVVVDPVYLYVALDVSALYDPNATQLTRSDLIAAIRQSIADFNSSQLSDFSADFYYSKLVAAIDATDPTIKSNLTSVRIIYKMSPIAGNPTSYSIDFGNAIAPGSVVSGQFEQLDSTGIVQPSSYIADNRSGVLNVYRVVGGVLTTIVANVGTVDYATGVIAVNNLTVYDYNGSVINLYATPVSNDINVGRDKIIQIQPSDVEVALTEIS